MSKIFKKSNIMPVIVLTVICIVIAAVLGVTNMFTKDRIEFNENQKKYESLKVVIDGAFEPMDKPAGAPKSVNEVYKVTDVNGNHKGYAVTLTVDGYASKISVTVGVSTDGSITKAVVTSEAETHGKSGMANYTDRFTGVAKDDVANVDTYTDATASSSAIKNAIIDAVNAVTGNITEEEPAPELPRDEAEIIASAKALIGTDTELTDVTPEDMKYALRIYKAGNEGYVAYTLVMNTGYGKPETETLVHVGMDGAIKKVNKLVWSTSPAGNGYTPPAEETVNAFYDKLIGKKASDLKAFQDADLVSGATSTSNNLRSALVEALEAVEMLISKEMPTSEEELIPLINDLLGKNVKLTNVTPENNTYVKRVYKAGNEGYVAYTVVMNTRYGKPETETLVHVGMDGAIKKVNKIVWSTSPAGNGYTPPAEETVNAFYDKLIGKKASDLKAFQDADLVSGATSTSNNLRSALVEALESVELLVSMEMPTPEEELIPLINALVGETVELTNVTPDDNTYVKRIYKAGDKGYVAYTVVVNTRYGTTETETLVYVGNDGRIKNVEKLVWSTSPAGNGYTPPTEETVNAFYAKLIGKKVAEISAFGTADLVSNATNTSTNLCNAIVEAMETIEDFTVRALADTLIGKDVELTDVTPENMQYVRRIYSAGNDGYVIYAVVVNTRYGTTETETLLHVGKDGKIVDVNRIIWKPSDAVPGLYEPPTEETVNAFYAKLIGKNASEISAFGNSDLVSNATTTSTSLKSAIVEGLEAVNAMEAKPDRGDNVSYSARIIGIVLLSVAILGFAAYKIVPKITKGRKNG